MEFEITGDAGGGEVGGDFVSRGEGGRGAGHWCGKARRARSLEEKKSEGEGEEERVQQLFSLAFNRTVRRPNPEKRIRDSL